MTLAIPDRPGNKRVDGFLNVLANPHVGLVFLIPGRGDTLRVNGSARLLRDAPFFDDMVVKGNRPALALLVEVEEVFFHCAKAFLRSQLWKPETWNPYKIVSFGKQFATKTGANDDVAKQIDDAIERDYRENL